MRPLSLAFLIATFGFTIAHATPLIPLNSPPKPTGDKLWDAYAGAVWQQLLHPESRPLPRPGLVPDGTIAQWTELQSDPRLWQLKLWTNAVAAQWVDEYAGPGAEDRVWGLIVQARTWNDVIEGRHEATLITRLYGIDLQEKLEVGRGRRDLEIPALDRARSTWFNYYEAIYNEGRSFAGGTEDFPDSAWPYYLKALYYEQLGEYDLALAQIAQGNAKPDFQLPLLFPCDKATTLLADDILGKQLDPGNLLVALAVRDVMGVERLPSILGEVTDFRASRSAYEFAEYSPDYPLYQLVRRALHTGEAAQLQGLATFAERVIAARPHDSRLAQIGLGAADGLVTQAQEMWEFVGQTPPDSPLNTDSWLDLTNLTALSSSRGRQMLFSSYGVGDLAWLYDQRFVQGKVPDSAEWTQRANAWVRPQEMPSPQQMVAAWHPEAPASGIPSATAEDTVALLNALAMALRQASAEYGMAQIATPLHDQNWAELLPPSS